MKKMADIATEMSYQKGLIHRLNNKIDEQELQITQANLLAGQQRKQIKEYEDKYVNVPKEEASTNVTQYELDLELPGRTQSTWCQTLKYIENDYEVVEYIRKKNELGVTYGPEIERPVGEEVDQKYWAIILKKRRWVDGEMVIEDNDDSKLKARVE